MIELPADMLHEIMLRVPLEHMINVYLALRPMYSIEYYQRKLLKTETIRMPRCIMHVVCVNYDVDVIMDVYKSNNYEKLTISYFPIPSMKKNKLYGIRGIIHNYDDKPAIYSDNGQYSMWMRYGEKHRDDGPAYIYNDIIRYYKCDILYDGKRFIYRPSYHKRKRMHNRILNILNIFPKATVSFIHKELLNYEPCVSIHFIRTFMRTIRAKW